MAGMTREEFLRRLSELHAEWEPEARKTVIVDPKYANNDPSQYAETITDISASPEADADYWRRAQALIAEYRGTSVG